jgi:glycosyltransferase involved in cell wall biosynthesis
LTLCVELLVPGSLTSLTGGYIYDRRVLEGLTALGWQTRAHALDTSFPEPTNAALQHAAAVLEAIPDGRVVIVDGLALAGLGPLLELQRARLQLVALIHHPLALETGLDPPKRKRLEISERIALSRVGRIIVTSNWTMAALADYGVDASRIDVVQPGVDAGLALVERSPGACLQLLTVGSLTARKGHTVLLDALATLADRQWLLRCVGSLQHDVETAAQIAEQIRRQGLSGRVELLGEVSPEAVVHEYDSADLFVLPSFLEGYGMVIAEAVARGLPVVSTTAGAIPETLPAQAGRLVPPGDRAALAGVLAELLDDRDQLTKLIAGARRASNHIPTWDQTSRAFATVLAGLARQ